eukprot:TRINITY_DN331_c1_g3_i1.p1 TRINITY_DN331_c1_g3~~TRINITY_DN331_c1_g3_i1.p1  ORF type:complete len:353 (-),score=62.54 TRINITY_DN331_c1_g3_i1:358-1416(-)
MVLTRSSQGKVKEVHLVVGGCGFLGRYIVEQLLETRGDDVTVRVFDLRKTFDNDAVDFVTGDLCNPSDLRVALQDVSVVYHTASPTHGRGRALYYRVNVDGTNNLIEMCKQCGVPKLVFTSSASVVFDGSDIKGGDESLPYCPRHIDPYNETKELAECAVLDANSNKLRTVALRPSGIFGPRDVQAWAGMIEAAKKNKTSFMIGDGSNMCDFTYVMNVAHAHVIAADRLEEGSNVCGQAYFITNDEPIPFWDMPKFCWKSLGYPLPKYQLPFGVVKWIACISDLVVWLLSPLVQIHPTFTYFRIVNCGANRHFSCEKAKRDLGYAPLVSLQEGMRRTAEYFQFERNPNVPAT